MLPQGLWLLTALSVTRAGILLGDELGYPLRATGHWESPPVLFKPIVSAPSMPKAVINHIIAPEVKLPITDHVLVPGIQTSVTNHVAPVVQNPATDHIVPELQKFVTDQIAPVVQTSVTDQIAPVFQKSITDQIAPAFQKSITDQVAPVLQKSITDHPSSVHQQPLISNYFQMKTDEFSPGVLNKIPPIVLPVIEKHPLNSLDAETTKSTVAQPIIASATTGSMPLTHTNAKEVGGSIYDHRIMSVVGNGFLGLVLGAPISSDLKSSYTQKFLSGRPTALESVKENTNVGEMHNPHLVVYSQIPIVEYISPSTGVKDSPNINQNIQPGAYSKATIIDQVSLLSSDLDSLVPSSINHNIPSADSNSSVIGHLPTIIDVLGSPIAGCQTSAISQDTVSDPNGQAEGAHDSPIAANENPYHPESENTKSSATDHITPVTGSQGLRLAAYSHSSVIDHVAPATESTELSGANLAGKADALVQASVSTAFDQPTLVRETESSEVKDGAIAKSFSFDVPISMPSHSAVTDRVVVPVTCQGLSCLVYGHREGKYS